MSKTSRSGGGEDNLPGFHGVLRLVEDDTAALHIFKMRSQMDIVSRGVSGGVVGLRYAHFKDRDALLDALQRGFTCGSIAAIWLEDEPPPLPQPSLCLRVVRVPRIVGRALVHGGPALLATVSWSDGSRRVNLRASTGDLFQNQRALVNRSAARPFVARRLGGQDLFYMH